VDEADVCVVWWRRVDGLDGDDIALLDDTERQRLDTYRVMADRVRFVTAAALLRRRAGAWTGVDAGCVVVDRSCPTCGAAHGRPTLPDLGLNASVTHSGDWVGVALTPVGPVGLDIERIAPVDVAALARHALGSGSGSDPGSGSGSGERLDDRAFFISWARKESLVKATGDGIGVGLAKVLVSAPAQPPALLGYPGRPGLVAVMHDLSPDEGYAGALSVLTDRAVHVRQHLPV
jgi:4'-phosphopantetheinyl transferase